MILGQTIGSARAEKHKATTLLVVCCLWTASMTSALAILSEAAWGTDSRLWNTARTSDTLRLPPIPYLETTPGLSSNASAPTLKIDHADDANGNALGHPADAARAGASQTSIELMHLRSVTRER